MSLAKKCPLQRNKEILLAKKFPLLRNKEMSLAKKQS
jgi:hypothetical protein